jgi:O-antigen/teichoic acid export membrane protein
MQFNRTSISNLAIRGFTILSRFILLFCLGKFFSTEELGTYGIFYTTINLSLLTIGFDFYTYSNREVLCADEKDRLTLLRNQLVFYGFTYLLLLLPLFLVFTFGIIPFQYIVFFYIILIFEHLSQEFYRLYTILSRPILANWLLFLRNGLWVLVLILLYAVEGLNDYSLKVVFTGWLIGSGLSVVIGFYTVMRTYGKYRLKSLDREWVLKGVKTSSLYFMSTASLLIIENLNRYLLEHWCGLSKVGVFTFFSQLSNIISVVVFTLFIMIIFPQLVAAVNAGDHETFRRLKAEFKRKVFISSVAVGLLLIVGVFPLLKLVNKPEYFEDLPTFFLLVTAVVLLNVSLVYHYILYAFKKDTSLLFANLISALFSICLNVLLIRTFEISGAALSLALSYLVLIFCLLLYSKKAEAGFIQNLPA